MISPESFPLKSGTNFCSKTTQAWRNQKSIKLKTNSVNASEDAFLESKTRFRRRELDPGKGLWGKREC